MTPNQSHAAGLQFALDTHIIGDLRARQQVEEIIQQAKSAPAEPNAELVALMAEVRRRCHLPDWARIRIDALLAKP